MNAGLVDYGRIGHSIGSHKFYPICNIKREGIARLRDPYTRGRRTVIPAMEQLKPQIMATKGNEKQSEVDPNNVIPSFEVAKELLPNALVWASLHGFVVGDRAVQRSGHIPGVGLTHAPFSLFPAPFPETCWSQACDLAPLFNELVDRVSMDGIFLQESLSGTRKVDDFTARLLDIHSKTLQDNIRQEIRLGLHRSDYMLDTETGSLLQIELNTISSSFAGLGCLVSQLHRYLIKHFGDQHCLDLKRVPENTTMKRYAEALAHAWKEFNDLSSIVLVVVQPEERNMYDQHWICMLLKELYGVSTVRKTLAEIDAEGEILSNGSLQIGQRVVAVVYFRAGYTPIDYPSEAEWRGRLMLEMSSAIKCPSISYHLAGSKKVQQELAKPNVLERFINNKDDALKLRKCFAGLWSLHSNAKIIQDAITMPEAFVLKPQREGGGNNIYGKDVKEKLLELEKYGGDGHAAYILMQRIFPPIHTSYLVRDGYCQQTQTVSELGIFGAYLRNKENVLINNQSGYLMRTKVASSDEGGVAAGFAVLDSIYLT
ncbi:glutathione synthetase, chloroplastic [Cryptomeria japonica]|uniref:glutathione synthetase, chloroplastic n=1 Tax=Cryptomeria japonica TaxID=3369 RepID=UPI0025AC113D|nr:glutathione synthetase, chloroplastic [Cryptomeria japonica]